MRIALLGLGLVGGSIARALRDRGSPWPMAAWSPSGGGPREAAAAGLLDVAAATPDEAIDGAELVVLAGPPLACLELLDRLGGPLRAALAPGATVTDVASTKAVLVARAASLALPYVGGHPMAGGEATGFGSARPDLFDGRPWVVVPGGDAEGTERVEALARAVGARPVRMSAADHDAAVAGISHLPLVVAAALVEAVAGAGDGPARSDWPAAAGLAATGWQGMTRLARGDVEMGAGIVATNGPAIAARLRDLRDVLDGWLAELDRPGGPGAGAVAARLRAARRRLEEPG